jgi:hypothetical protein
MQGVFHKASSVQLRNLMRTSDDEAMRQACYEGLRSIGPHVAGGWAGFFEGKFQRLAREAFPTFLGGPVTCSHVPLPLHCRHPD